MWTTAYRICVKKNPGMLRKGRYGIHEWNLKAIVDVRVFGDGWYGRQAKGLG